MPRRSAATARSYKEFCGKINHFTLAQQRKRYRENHKKKVAEKIAAEERMREDRKWVTTKGMWIKFKLCYSALIIYVEDEVYVLDKIFLRKEVDDKIFYFVSWENYPLSESSWISKEDFTDVSAYAKFDVKLAEKEEFKLIAETKWNEQSTDLMSRNLFEENESNDNQ